MDVWPLYCTHETNIILNVSCKKKQTRIKLVITNNTQKDCNIIQQNHQEQGRDPLSVNPLLSQICYDGLWFQFI